MNSSECVKVCEQLCVLLKSLQMLKAIWSLSAMQSGLTVNRPGRRGNEVSVGRERVWKEREDKVENERERWIKKKSKQDTEQKVWEDKTEMWHQNRERKKD